MSDSEQPALLGGPKALDRKRLPVWPMLANNAAVEELKEIIIHGKWPMGDQTVRFEKMFAEYCGARHALLVTNCTQAMDLTLRSLGVKPGDEVIIPSVAFISDLTTVMMIGATPVMADVDPQTCNISPDGVARCLTDKTKAILTLPYSGIPCDSEKIRDIAKQRNVPVIEDAAHAHGSVFRGKQIGAWANATCFSFDQNKVVSAGQGGAIVTDDEQLYKRLKRMRSFGVNNEMSIPDYLYYSEVSGNYKPTDIQAVLLCHQLSALDCQIAQRKKQYDALSYALEGLTGLRPVKLTPGTERLSYYNMRLNYVCESWGGLDRNLLIKALLSEGIPLGAGWAPLYYRLEAFTGWKDLRSLDEWALKLPNAEATSRMTIVLPINLLMADGDVIEDAVRGFRKVYDHASEILEFYNKPQNRVKCQSDVPAVLAGYHWLQGKKLSGGIGRSCQP